MLTVISPHSTNGWTYLNPRQAGGTIWKYRGLIRELTEREIRDRYSGSILGIVWSLLNPLVLLLVYAFVFGVIYRSRWPQTNTDAFSEFALVLFAGLLAFNVLSETATRSADVVVSVPHYVKKMVFPIEVLPVSVLAAALFHALVRLGVLLCAALLLHGSLPWTVMLLPLVFLPLVLLCLGVGWVLASLGVFLRDVSQTIGLVMQVLLFATPVLYPANAVPAPWSTLLALNPLSRIVDDVRRVALWGVLPEWPALVFWTVVAGALAVLGYAWFMRTRVTFADIL